MRFSDFNPHRCTLCPRLCGADRTAAAGLCGGGALPRAARCALHMWEEPCISGTRGSGTVFFTGCPLGCVFCQNYEISARRSGHGKTISAALLSDEFLRLESLGAHNINLVTPTHFAPWIAQAIERARSGGLSVPVVWNTGGYERVETLRELDGLVDVYMPDLKYFSPDLSQKLSGAANYFAAASAAIAEMFRQVGRYRFGPDSTLERGLLVRHLVLPGHADDSIRVFEELSELVPPDDILVGVMSQYTPPAEYGREVPGLPEELRRRVTAGEYELVCECVSQLGFTGYAQDPESADAAYTPEWDYVDNSAGSPQ